MLAGVTDCGRSRKGGCRGGLALGYKTQARQPDPGEDHTVLRETGEGTTRLWQSGDPVAATRLMVPGA